MVLVKQTDEFDHYLSTRIQFPGNVAITVKGRLPLGGGMASSTKRTGERVLAGLVILGSPVCGALLMNHLAPGGVSAGFGMAMGTVVGLGAVLAHKVIEMKLSGAGVGFEVKVDAAVQEAADAKLLAEMAAQTALYLAQMPSGGVGDRCSTYSGLRKMMYDKLNQLGLSGETKRIFAAEDWYVARLIIWEAIIGSAAKELTAGNVPDENRLPILRGLNELHNGIPVGATTFPTTKDIEDVIAGTPADTSDVRRGIRFYDQWLGAKLRVEFMIEQAPDFYKAFPG